MLDQIPGKITPQFLPKERVLMPVLVEVDGRDVATPHMLVELAISGPRGSVARFNLEVEVVNGRPRLTIGTTRNNGTQFTYVNGDYR